MSNSKPAPELSAACSIAQPGPWLRDSLAECDSSGEVLWSPPELCSGKGWGAAATDAQPEALGVPKEDEFPLSPSEYELAPVRKLFFCLKEPSEINTDCRPFLLGHCSGRLGFQQAV